MKNIRQRRASKLLRTYERLACKLGAVFPIEVKKQTCTMVLRFSSNDYDKYKTIDDFLSMLKVELSKMCKSNDLDFVCTFFSGE